MNQPIEILTDKDFNAALPAATSAKYEFVEHPHGMKFAVTGRDFKIPELTPAQAAWLVGKGYKFLKRKSAKTVAKKPATPAK